MLTVESSTEKIGETGLEAEAENEEDAKERKRMGKVPAK